MYTIPLCSMYIVQTGDLFFRIKSLRTRYSQLRIRTIPVFPHFNFNTFATTGLLLFPLEIGREKRDGSPFKTKLKLVLILYFLLK